MMSQTIQQRRRQLLVPKDLHPLPEVQVGGDGGGSRLVPIGEQVEEQLAPGPVEGHKPQFVDDEQVSPLQPPLELTQGTLIPGLQQGARQIGGPCEDHPKAASCRFHSQTDDQVGLPGAHWAQHNQVLSPLQVGAAGQLQDLRSGDALQRLPVQLVQGLQDGKAGLLKPAGGSAVLAGTYLRL